MTKQALNTSEKVLSVKNKSWRFYFLLLVGFCFVVFGNTLFNEYGLDDHLVTNHNPLVEKGLKGLPEIFATNYIDEEGIQLDYRPLVKATYVIEYSLFGWSPHISHFINVLLYALASCLILRVLVLVFARVYFATIFCGLLIYIVHPVHTEVVASLKNRDEVLVLVFVFLSALFFLRETEGKRDFIIGLCLFLLALLSKISCLPFVASIPLLVYFKTGNLKRSIAVFGALTGLVAVYYALIVSSLPGFARPYEYVETPFPYLDNWNTKFGTAFYSMWWYLRLLVFPQPLSFYYGFNYVELKSLASLLPVVSLLIHLSIAASALFLFKRNKLVSFLLLFYLIQISLYSNLVLPLAGVVAERALLFASLSFCVGLSFVFVQLFKKEGAEQPKTQGKNTDETFSIQLPVVRVILVALIVIGFAGLSIARNVQWKDTITLFEADMPHLENSAKANYMMAKEVRRLYRTDANLTKEKLAEQSAKAIHFYKKAIKAYPKYAAAMEELGMIYAVEQRNVSMAIPIFEKAISVDSTRWRSASNLGMAYQISKDTATSVKWYEHSLKVHSDNPKVLVELAKLYYMAGRKQEALECNEKLMKLNPESNVPYYNYAIYYMMEKDTAQAIKYFEQDVQHGEREEFPYYFLFTRYLEQGDSLNALRIKRQAQAVRR